MALLALAKNPLKQERMLKELRRIGGGEAAFLAAFESELTDEEAAIDDQYRAGQGKVSSHENHRKVLLNHFDTDDLVYAGTRLMEMFDDTPERPDGLTSHDYKVWMLRIIRVFRSINGIGKYMSRQLARAIKEDVISIG